MRLDCKRNNHDSFLSYYQFILYNRVFFSVTLGCLEINSSIWFYNAFKIFAQVLRKEE